MQKQPYLELSKVLANHADGSTCSIDAKVYAIIENSGLEKLHQSIDVRSRMAMHM